MKIAFLFPGQGAQKPGMGKDLCEKYPEAKNIFEQADSILGFRLSGKIFEGSSEELRQTRIAQVAILTVELAAYEALKAKGIVPYACAGHSLGEYAALVAAGSMSFGSALSLVQKRALFMEEAALKVPSGMTALIGLDAEVVEGIVREVSPLGVIDIANFNSPGQIVISGESRALEKAASIAAEKGAKMCVPLQVSGGFHSRIMDAASASLYAELEKTDIKEPGPLFLSNYTGNFEKEPGNIRRSLVSQVNNSVRWTDIMQKTLECGVDRIVEIGPGKVLSGLWKRFDRTAQVYNIEDSETLEKTACLLNN